MSARLERPRTSRKRVRAIEHCEREAVPDRDDRGDRPAVKGLLRDARHVLRERNVPRAGEHEPMTLVEVGVTLVNLRVERIQQPKICVVIGFAEGRADVVNGMGIGVARMQAEPRVRDIR